jgi:hypothetical protein
MFNEIILLFLIYQLNNYDKNDAINIVKNYRHTFNYYDFTLDEYDEFIINIQKFFNDIYELLETKIIPNITILRNNLPKNII